MLKRQTAGSVVCPNCGRLVGVRDERCFICGRWNPGLWGWGPSLARLGGDLGFAKIVIGGCVGLFLIALLRNPSGIQMRGLLGLLSPAGSENLLLGASGAGPIFDYGRWWTVLSAGWLHGGLLHILFNMMWIRQMVPAVASLFGVGRMVVIYTIASVVGFGLTSWIYLLHLPGPLAGAGVTLGASAPLFGLFGALFLYGQRTGNRSISRQMTQFLLIMLVFGVLVPGVDNWAHLGGFAGGYLAAKIMDPLKPEQQHHLLLGLACLVAMVLSIIASVLHGLSLGWPATIAHFFQ
jgi:rhomboid protease GluP